MFVSVWRVLGAGVAILLLGMMGMARGSADAAGLKEIEAFNKRFVELHLKMDTSGIMAMWAENGVDLMQGEAPIRGERNNYGVVGGHPIEDAGIQGDEARNGIL